MYYLSYPKLVGSFGGGFVMFAVDVCDLPDTGGSTFVLIAGLFLLVAGVIVARWVSQSAGRLSVVVAPLVLLGGLVLAPQVTDPCAPATTTVLSATTTVLSATTTVLSATTTVPSATTTVPSATTTTTTTTTTTLAPVVYQVDQTGPGGGIVFYVHANGTFACGETLNQNCTYLEVAPNTWNGGSADPLAPWGCDQTPIAGADGTAIGAGRQNTTDIVNGCATSGIAALLANDLTLGGQSDWFLPSKDELNALCKWAFGDTVNAICNNGGSGGLSLTGVGGFSIDLYWSSSELSGDDALDQNFYIGSQAYNSKDLTDSVRPVRAF